MIIIESLVNLFQSIVDCIFLAKCLGMKKKYEKWQIYAGMIVSIFVFFEIQQYITSYDGFGIFISLMVTCGLSFVFLRGDVLNTIIYNVILTVMAMFSSIIGANIVGILCGSSFMQLTQEVSYGRVLALVVIQVIWVFFLVFVIKHHDSQMKYYYKKGTYISLLIPILSMILCIIVSTKMDGGEPVWNIVVVLGIFVLNAMDFILIDMVNKSYVKAVSDEILINSYEQQQIDVENIKREYYLLEKNRHEMKKIIGFITQMTEENRNDRLKSYLGEIDVDTLILEDNKTYTDNIVLNYVLNRTSEECKQSEIDFVCTVYGTVDGVSDMALHIIMGNLTDNALEAAKQSADKRLYVAVNANEQSINIEVTNSTKGDVLADNPEFITTKEDKLKHGYGINNIKDALKDYSGSIEYSYIQPNTVLCSVVMVKKEKVK